MDLLPDSRTRSRRGAVQTANGWYVPVYCANCGKLNGLVPERLINHVFALCDEGCSGKWGKLAASYQQPEQVFRDHLGEALGNGRIVTPAELEQIAASRTDVAALLRDWRNFASREDR